jgi:hypothetical protein
MRLTRLIREKLDNPVKLTLLFSLPLVVIFVVLLGILLVREGNSHGRYFLGELRESARAYFQQIVITRAWNSQHGGVYVAITEKTPPNPYLKDADRDIVTKEGRRLTKLNPAYMTRQIAEIAEKRGSYLFRITSLKPLNPRNKPTDWEARALGSFERGEGEASEIITMGGKEYFGYMAPLMVERSCLRCHQEQGYSVGDIRGGIGVYIPLGVRAALHGELTRESLLALLAIGLFSLIVMVFMIWMFSKRLSEGFRAELETERLKTAVHMAGAAAHELRQPLTVISGFVELLKDRTSDKGLEEVDIIRNQCQRMDDIIRKMLNITRYKTKNYSDGTEIFDLHEGGENEEDPPPKTP